MMPIFLRFGTVSYCLQRITHLWWSNYAGDVVQANGNLDESQGPMHLSSHAGIHQYPPELLHPTKNSIIFATTGNDVHSFCHMMHGVQPHHAEHRMRNLNQTRQCTTSNNTSQPPNKITNSLSPPAPRVCMVPTRFRNAHLYRCHQYFRMSTSSSSATGCRL
jgi:hypothetical protein